jgi:hypothetical protein
MRSLTRPLAAVGTTVWLLSVPSANAQVQSPPPGASQQSQSIPDQKLDAAAAALEQVSTVKERYQQQIQDASPSERQRITSEAESALETAITGQGLSVEEYSSIIVVAQNNPDVRQRLLQRVRPATK